MSIAKVYLLFSTPSTLEKTKESKVACKPLSKVNIKFIIVKNKIKGKSNARSLAALRWLTTFTIARNRTDVSIVTESELNIKS